MSYKLMYKVHCVLSSDPDMATIPEQPNIVFRGK